jgi:FkbM family methyltransferase
MQISNEYFESPENLILKIINIVNNLNKDIYSILPDWLDQTKSILNTNVIVCGSTCHEEIRVLANVCNIKAIVDDDLSKKGKMVFGFPCISTGHWIDQVKSNPKLLSIILVPTLRGSRHFIKQCIQHNLIYVTPLQLLLIFHKNNIDTGISGRFFRYGLSYLDFVLKNADSLIFQSKRLADNYSTISFLNYLLYRLTLNPGFLESIAVGRGYAYDYNAYLFDKTFLNINQEEVYVDCGAYTGDSISAFLESTNGNYRHIYSFEPSPDNNYEIKKRMLRLQSIYLKDLTSSISIIEKGVWSSTCILNFISNVKFDLGGHMEESDAQIFTYNPQQGSKIIVPVTTIDEATNRDATFIKMEVEGSELEGLKGGKNTIIKNKPKLSIPVYHKPEDILTLPNFIESLDLNYKIGFRQHDLFTPDATYLYCY